MKTGNTCSSGLQRLSRRLASMEPGHEDREYTAGQALTLPGLAPQWSPVMKTGNTPCRPRKVSESASLNGARS